MGLLRKILDVIPSGSGSAPTTSAVVSANSYASSSFAPPIAKSKTFYQAITRNFTNFGYSKEFYDTLFLNSTTTEKLISLQPTDMFIAPRLFDGDEDNVAAFQKELLAFDVENTILRAIIASRLYGVAAIFIVSEDAEPSLPLKVDNFPFDALRNLLIIDKFNLNVSAWQNDPLQKDYGKPIAYDVNLPLYNGKTQIIKGVHASRFIVFYGIKSLSEFGLGMEIIGGSQEIGFSLIDRALHNLAQDYEIGSDIALLVQIANIDTLKIRDLKQAMAGMDTGLGMNYGELIKKYAELRDIQGVSIMDADDDLQRKPIQFGGLPEIMDKFRENIAHAADIPMSRFNGTSPGGFNSTGENELVNYSMSIEAKRNAILPPVYDVLDKIIMKNAGIDEDITYKFQSILKATDAEKADIIQKVLTSAVAGVNAYLIDEEEGRDLLKSTGQFDFLKDEIPQVPTPPAAAPTEETPPEGANEIAI